jgi:hypothetical protein
MNENELMSNFLSRLRHRYSIDSESMGITDWLEQNTTLRKKPYSIKGYEFQRQIADDLHINMSVIKPSQVGLTEIQIRKALAFVRRNDGVSVIYSMPTDDMRNRLSQTRIKPIVENDTVFMTEFDEDAVRAKGLMQFGQSFLYLTGSKEADATSIAADMLMSDEIDLADDPEMLNLFRSRLQGSKYKINQRFSTPTYPKAGVSQDYTDSDQHEYFIKCHSCNHQQVPDFSRKFCDIPGIGDDFESLVDQINIDNVGDLDLRNSVVVCEKCRTPLHLGDAERREWVPLKPSLSDIARGYRVRPFSLEGLDIRYIVGELIEAKKKTSLRRFHNTVLGEAYIDDSIALSEDMVRAAMGQQLGWHYNGQQVFLGIDVGQNCHVVMGTWNRTDGWNVFHWQVVPATQLEEHVKNLLKDYKIVGGAIDRHPYTPTAVAVRALSEGKIIPVEYRGLTEVNVKENELTPEEGYAQVNKTQLLDDVARAIRQKEMIFTNYGKDQSIIIEHMMDNVRHEEEGEKAVWKKQTGNDHYFHAIAFMLASKKLADFIIANDKNDVRTLVMANNVDIKKRSNDNLGSNTGDNRIWRQTHLL